MFWDKGLNEPIRRGCEFLSQRVDPAVSMTVWTPWRPTTCTRSSKLKSAGSTAFWLGWTTAPSFWNLLTRLHEATTRLEN
jgi:hypothetical protein